MYIVSFEAICMKCQSDRKLMIRNYYNYLTPSGQDTKGKEGQTKSNGTTIKTLQEESQKDSFFPKNWLNGYLK